MTKVLKVCDGTDILWQRNPAKEMPKGVGRFYKKSVPHLQDFCHSLKAA
jgi:hypothetical protein